MARLIKAIGSMQVGASAALKWVLAAGAALTWGAATACLAQTNAPVKADCAALSAVNLPGVTTLSVTAVPAGPFRTAQMPMALPVPAFCRVIGRITAEPGSDIRFEVWMPVDGWSGRLNGAGNGGFAGSISYLPGLVEAVEHGEAGVSTDTGHEVDDAEDGRWAKGHPERIRDYGWRAVHLSTLAAKALIAKFYGRPAEHAYFTSCSNGGRQGLMEAERFPDDYDGVVAGAPAYDFVPLLAAMAWDVRAQLAPGAAIPITKTAAIQRAVLASCDALDGVQDGIVADPRVCRFDPAVLTCKGGDNDLCLTAPQVAALRAIYRGPHTSSGVSIYPGFPISGGEVGQLPGSGWDGWIFAPPGSVAHDQRYPRDVLSSFVAHPFTDIARFDFDHDPARLERELGADLDADNPDLHRFVARGGKLILWHGWADPGLPPEATLTFYERIRGAIGGKLAAQGVRLFMVPGVQHCLGGPGLNSFGQFAAPIQPADPSADMVAALEAWVETGRAPASLQGRHADNPLLGALDWRSAASTGIGLICAYPSIATSGAVGAQRCEAPSHAELAGR